MNELIGQYPFMAANLMAHNIIPVMLMLFAVGISLLVWVQVLSKRKGEFCDIFNEACEDEKSLEKVLDKVSEKSRLSMILQYHEKDCEILGNYIKEHGDRIVVREENVFEETEVFSKTPIRLSLNKFFHYLNTLPTLLIFIGIWATLMILSESVANIRDLPLGKIRDAKMMHKDFVHSMLIAFYPAVVGPFIAFLFVLIKDLWGCIESFQFAHKKIFLALEDVLLSEHSQSEGGSRIIKHPKITKIDKKPKKGGTGQIKIGSLLKTELKAVDGPAVKEIKKPVENEELSAENKVSFVDRDTLNKDKDFSVHDIEDGGDPTRSIVAMDIKGNQTGDIENPFHNPDLPPEIPDDIKNAS